MRLLAAVIMLIALAGCGPKAAPSPAPSTAVSATTTVASEGSSYFASSERARPFEEAFNSITTKMAPAIKAQQIGAVSAYRQQPWGEDTTIIPSCPEVSPHPSTFAFGDGYVGPVLFCSDAKGITVRGVGLVKGDAITSLTDIMVGTDSIGAVALNPDPRTKSFDVTFHFPAGGTLAPLPDMSVSEIKAIDQQILDRLKKIRAEFGW